MSLELWERRPAESDEAFEAFVVYRDMPLPRSQRGAAERLGKSRQLLSQWSMRHDWQDRVAAWDLEQDRQRREAMARENVEAGKRHAQIAAGALQAAARVNLAFLARLGDPGSQEAVLEKMGFTDLADLLVKVNRTIPRLVVAERLARGMSTESVEHSGTIDTYRRKAEGMTDAELDAFLAGAAAQAAADAVHEGDPVE